MTNTYARRTRTIIADDGGINVQVNIAISVRNRRLTRDEHAHLMDQAASRVMEMIPGLRYVDVPLSRVKVSR